MKLSISLHDDQELRKEIREMVRGCVKSEIREIMSEEVKTIMEERAETLENRIYRDAKKQVDVYALKNRIVHEVSSEIRPLILRDVVDSLVNNK